MTRWRIVSATLIVVPLLLVASNSLAYASTAFTSGQRGLGTPRLVAGPSADVSVRPLGSHPGSLGADTIIDSDSWAGYVAQSPSIFTSVTTTYVQPKVTCPAGGSGVYFWVGLDGYTDNTIEQDGTGAYCGGTDDTQVFYFAWWCMYPSEIQYFPGRRYLHAGDKVKATVTYSAGDYTLTVKNLTAGKSNAVVEACTAEQGCARSSAEWIVENPEADGLADFGTANFSGAKAATTGSSEPISDFTYTVIDMVDSDDNYLAQAGNLNTKGNKFGVTWDAAS
jgi:Peptidase A4 family